MPQLVGDADHPLVELEGDFSELTPRQKMALTYLAMGKKNTWISKKLAMGDGAVHSLTCRADAKLFVSELTQGAHLQMEALYVKSVEAVRETLEKGKYPDKIKAARLQMEATKRIGSMTSPIGPIVDTNLRLTKLAERLLMLNDNSKREIQTRRTPHGYEVHEEHDITPPASEAGAGQGDRPGGED